MPKNAADQQKRLDRERHTLQVMLQIYCCENHSSPAGDLHPAGVLCVECQHLSDYAMQRINRCPYQADKPTCARCPIHCYRPTMRQQVRLVMRYAGPRMLFTHPALAVLHLMDELTHRKPSKKP